MSTSPATPTPAPPAPRGGRFTPETARAAGRKRATAFTHASQRAAALKRVQQFTRASQQAAGRCAAAALVARYGAGYLQRRAADRRRAAPTPPEQQLHAALAVLGFVKDRDYRREEPVTVCDAAGRPRTFAVDVCLPGQRAIEADGYWHTTPAGAAHDAARDALLQAAGWQILRLSDTLLVDAAATVARLAVWLQRPIPPAAAAPPPAPPPDPATLRIRTRRYSSGRLTLADIARIDWGYIVWLATKAVRIPPAWRQAAQALLDAADVEIPF